MRLYWTFMICGSRYTLIGISNKEPAPLEPIFSPGYQSCKLKDILEAAWYLNYGYTSGLSDNLLSVLNQIKADAYAKGFEF